ncbi:MAG: methylaspartate mutase subunit S, partial [Planctomycetota bacterium]
LYGHGEIDCAGFRDACLTRGLSRITLYVGGNLVVGKAPKEEVEDKFKLMGFDRVFGNDVDLEEVEALLSADLGED